MKASDQIKDTTVYRGPEHHLGPAHEPSATDAVERVLDAGQRLISERIELAKLDVEEAVTQRVSRTALVAVPSLFAFGGWWVLMAGVVAFLDAYVALPVSLAIVGGTHVVLGGGIAAAALARERGPRNGRGATSVGARP